MIKPQKKLSQALTQAEEKILGDFLAASTREAASPKDAEEQLLTSLTVTIRQNQHQS